MFLLRNQDFHNFPSFNSFRQDRSGDSAEPQAPIGSGGKRFREPRSGGEEASNFVKATFGRGRGVHQTRLPHPSAERRARRSPEGDVVQIGESINASKDLEGSDRNEDVSGRGPRPRAWQVREVRGGQGHPQGVSPASGVQGRTRPGTRTGTGTGSPADDQAVARAGMAEWTASRIRRLLSE